MSSNEHAAPPALGRPPRVAAAEASVSRHAARLRRASRRWSSLVAWVTGGALAQGARRRRRVLRRRDRLELLPHPPAAARRGGRRCARIGRAVTVARFARRPGRGALRRPVVDPRAARDRAQCALVGDRGAAADAAQQPRSRGRRAPRGARRLRRHGQGGALARGAAGDRPRRCSSSTTTRRCSCSRASRSPSSARRRRRAARADRQLAARAELGDVGRVPPARGRRADDVRPDDGRVVDLHRHAGDPAGHVPDVRGGRREALRRCRRSPGGRS